jgi:hypothetical protein
MELRETGYRIYEGIYRGKAVKIQGHHRDDGFRKERRWWSFETCGNMQTDIAFRATAEWWAKRTVDQTIDGAFYWRPSWYRFFYDEPLEQADLERSRNSELIEKLKQMTVERGCSESEAATAKRKLQKFRKNG